MLNLDAYANRFVVALHRIPSAAGSWLLEIVSYSIGLQRTFRTAYLQHPIEDDLWSPTLMSCLFDVYLTDIF
jgi:hypothetical protein